MTAITKPFHETLLNTSTFQSPFTCSLSTSKYITVQQSTPRPSTYFFYSSLLFSTLFYFSLIYSTLLFTTISLVPSNYSGIQYLISSKISAQIIQNFQMCVTSCRSQNSLHYVVFITPLFLSHLLLDQIMINNKNINKFS